MTVGDLRRYLQSFTDECEVYVPLNDNGMLLLAPAKVEYNLDRGTGHLIIGPVPTDGIG